ncbi:hypothetical protein NUW54_g706 [Trametes sanguinea]|uniref:Uncharacterized protein n=2 Tax=Trametes sanguinea TaxID=158606 RepID=A0ACC1Q7B5_9APHY|nr:hypothetical protein NUW54_g2124 [Trametes sanguinea]KAJ3016909.1 hypothetical protein NUW54_g706 [Trametes sanguinea]
MTPATLIHPVGPPQGLNIATRPSLSQLLTGSPKAGLGEGYAAARSDPPDCPDGSNRFLQVLCHSPSERNNDWELNQFNGLDSSKL